MVFGKEMSLPLGVALLPTDEINRAPKDYIDYLIKEMKILQEIA